MVYQNEIFLWLNKKLLSNLYEVGDPGISSCVCVFGRGLIDGLEQVKSYFKMSLMSNLFMAFTFSTQNHIYLLTIF